MTKTKIKQMTMITTQAAIAEAAEVLRCSKQPLIIVGKGAAYSRGEKEVVHLAYLLWLSWTQSGLDHSTNT